MKLTAKTANGRVKLSWIGIKGANSYFLKRNDGKGLETIANLKYLEYVDSKVKSGLRYFYVVSAIVNGNEVQSNKVSVIV